MQRLISLLPLLALWVLLSPPAWAVHPVDSYEFQTPGIERRALTLARKLRCPQCQNQNLVESNASIAQDLRLEVYQLADSGKSDEEIVAYMTERFGDFVLYDPPLNATTLLLWGTPFLLLFFAFRFLWRTYQKKSFVSATTYQSGQSDTSRERINHAIGQTERRHLNYRYADAPQLKTELDEELARTHNHGTISLPLPGIRSQWLTPCLIATTLLIALTGYIQSGRWQTATEWRQRPDPLLSLAGEELKDAAELRLETRLRANPRDLDAWTELGQLYLYRNRFDQALQIYDRVAAIEGKMTASTLAAKATVLYYQAGQRLTPEAQHLLDEALFRDEGEVTALMLQASDHFLNARYNEAIALWQRLLDESRPRVNREAVIRAIQTARMLEN